MKFNSSASNDIFPTCEFNTVFLKFNIIKLIFGSVWHRYVTKNYNTNQKLQHGPKAEKHRLGLKHRHKAKTQTKG